MDEKQAKILVYEAITNAKSEAVHLYKHHDRKNLGDLMEKVRDSVIKETDELMEKLFPPTNTAPPA